MHYQLHNLICGLFCLWLFLIYFVGGVFVCFMKAFEWAHTWVECCRIATRRSWMRRISSNPVLMCSGFNSRTQDAKSVHCNSVSSAECKNMTQFKYYTMDNQIFVMLRLTKLNFFFFLNYNKTQTKQDLQGIRVKVQGFSLLLHDIHFLCVLIVIAVHTWVGQHLRSKKYESLTENKELLLKPETPACSCIQNSAHSSTWFQLTFDPFQTELL